MVGYESLWFVVDKAYIAEEIYGKSQDTKELFRNHSQGRPD